MQKTEKGIKKFSKQEKLRILTEAKKNGVKVTLTKYDLYPATYYYWKKKFIVYGAEGLDHKKVKDANAQILRLEKENETLKIILGELQLESKLKDDLLKNKYPELGKKKW